MRVVWVVCAALLAAPAAVQAQAAEELAAGTRVRVAAPATGRLVGTVSEVRGDTLLVLSRRGVHALPLSSVRTLQVSRGRPTRLASALEGGAAGLVLGVVSGAAGAVLGDLTISDDDCNGGEDDLLCFSTGQWALIGALAGAPLGVAYGAVAGFVFPRERWRSVGVGSAPVLAVQPSAAGVGISLSIPTP
jgi:hypothetical protein